MDNQLVNCVLVIDNTPLLIYISQTWKGIPDINTQTYREGNVNTA